MIIAVLLFSLIICLHELGHFITAKLSGVKVKEFALGMGPAIFKFQKGETLYTLRALPFGGFCSMEGEDEESKDDRAFSNKAVWKRIIIVSAGAIMNIILGFILMIILLVQSNYFVSTTISGFRENSVSSTCGLEVGDTLVSVNGYRIYTHRDIAFALFTNKNSIMDITVKRGNEIVNLENVRFPTTTDNSGNEIPSLDFYLEPIQKTFLSLISQSFKSVVCMIRTTWAGLIGVITGQFGLDQITGPVGAASAITEAASEGLAQGFVQAVNNIIFMIAVLTISIGIFNLLPLPALDGGRLVFLLIEAITRKPVNPKYEGFIHAAGFVLLLILMAVFTVGDVMRLFTGKGLGG